MKKSLASLFIGLALTSSVSAQSSDEKRWFEVEVIVFERLTENDQAKEHWQETDMPKLSNKHIDPFSLFLDEKNLVSYQLAASAALAESASSAMATETSTEPQLDLSITDPLNSVETVKNIDNPQVSNIDIIEPIIVDEGDLLIVGNDDISPLVSHISANDSIEKVITKPIIVATNPEIDGAELIDEVKNDEFDIAPAEELQLIDQVNALKQHANYQLLMHSAWRMPPTTKRRAIPIRLFAGKNYQARFNQDGSPIVIPEFEALQTPTAIVSSASTTNIDTDTAPNFHIEPNFSNSASGVVTTPVLSDEDKFMHELAEKSPLWQLDGELLIYLDHYLYAETSLYIRQQTTRDVVITDLTQDQQTSVEQDLLSLSSLTIDVTAEEETVEADEEQIEVEKQQQAFLQSYPMKQLRVIRSGEIHYFDHPKFGIIMQIRKYEKPEPVIEEIAENEKSTPPQTNVPTQSIAGQ